MKMAEGDNPRPGYNHSAAIGITGEAHEVYHIPDAKKMVVVYTQRKNISKTIWSTTDSRCICKGEGTANKATAPAVCATGAVTTWKGI